MRASSAASVGRRPATPTHAFSSRSADDLGRERCDALGALEDAAREPVACPRGRCRIGDREGRDAVLVRERDQRSVVTTGGQCDDLDIGEGRDDVEGLAADRPRRAQQGDALHWLPG